MSEKNTRCWMVRAGGGYLIEEFLEKGLVSLGWNEIGNLSDEPDREEIKRRLTEKYPEASKGWVNSSAGQIHRFLYEIKEGDRVVTYDNSLRAYFLGEVKSAYQYATTHEYHHIRKVDWADQGQIRRDDLKTASKNTLGSVLTLFEVPQEVYEDLNQNHPGYIDISEEEFEEHARMAEKDFQEYLKEEANQLIANSSDMVKDVIARLNWKELEILVAGIMRAMGYKTRMTSKGGGDLGSDIIVSPDGLGLMEPFIKVEVKQRSKDKIQAPEIRQFVGGLRNQTKGIFVTSTGFTKEAQYEAQRANFQISLVDIDYLVELLVEHYEKLDPETKALVPLRKVYWPV